MLDMVGLDRMAAGVGVGVAAGWGDPRCVSTTNGSARSAALELVVWYGLQTLCECRKRVCGAAADLDSGENQLPGEDAGRKGQ